jgi:hypothetical protein
MCKGSCDLLDPSNERRLSRGYLDEVMHCILGVRARDWAATVTRILCGQKNAETVEFMIVSTQVCVHTQAS